MVMVKGPLPVNREGAVSRCVRRTHQRLRSTHSGMKCQIIAYRNQSHFKHFLHAQPPKDIG